MTQILLYGVLMAISVMLFAFPSKPRALVGWLALIVGLSVFAIRLQHEGPYAFARQGNLLSGVLALVLGVALIRPWFGTSRVASLLTRAALAATPIVLFFALYATFAELEEVVVLRATDAQGRTQDLRLWIVDHEGAAWVTMPRSKADAHGLTDARVELLRNGVAGCVIAKRHEEYAAVDEVFRLRHEKYRVQRLATTLGIFGRSVGENVVTLRLEPCPPRASGDRGRRVRQLSAAADGSATLEGV
jgi:hypothetical protein